MQIFGIIGWQNSGKTTLITQLISYIRSHQFSVSTIKHAHHGFDIDKPGKDSYKHREAGASEVLISSANRWALMHEITDRNEFGLDQLLTKITPVDLVLIEGFKSEPHPKIEVYRSSLGKEPIWPNDPSVIAIATDEDISVSGRAVLDLSDIENIGEFILNHFDLKTSCNDQEAL